MRQLTVQTKISTYPIIIHHDFSHLHDILEQQGIRHKKLCIIADDNVSPLYMDAIKEIMTSAHNDVCHMVIPHGEDHKHLDTINTIYEGLLTHRLDRESILVALGGGVTGDMVGFAAATYMRGIKFIQIPTTLLSQVDSSIGGKTGVDFNGYKNIIGAFHQPEFVYINTHTLSTLPLREVSAGMAEVIKHGLIANKSYYHYLEKQGEAILKLDAGVLEEVIYESCKIKTAVVSIDEKEKGLRATLNFGHTIGHAVERLLDFNLLHGECVAIGIVAAAYISYSLGQITEEDLKGIEECLVAYGLPTRIDQLQAETIYSDLFYDKKTKNDQLNVILLTTIGSCEIRNDLSQSVIMDGIHYILEGDTLC